MNTEQTIIFLILITTLIMFAWGRFRYDIVAMAALMACVLAKLVDPANAFSGFGHPAVITVACVLIISHALQNSGVVDLIAVKLAPHTKNIYVHVGALTALVTIASAFMNNVGALALMLPVAIATAHEHKRSPAFLLMPLAFGSILGGMTTLIGTPPNIIIASYKAEIGLAGYNMFDFSFVGVPIALLGVVFISFLGWKLIPRERTQKNVTQQLMDVNEYLTEVRIPKDCDLIGQSLEEAVVFNTENIEVIGLARGNGRAGPVPQRHVIEDNDVLIIKADPNEITKVIDENGLELVTTADQAFQHLTNDLSMAEAIIMPGSQLEGRTIAYFRRRTGHAIAMVALSRSGHTVINKRLRRQVLQSGDILLLQGSEEVMETAFNNLGLLAIAKRNIKLGRERKIGLAVGIFAAAIGLGVAGILPLVISFVLAIAGFIATGILKPRQLYSEIDWPVIVLIAAMIPIGRALESTGATALIANSIVTITDGLPIWAIMALMLIITMLLTDIINNAATALVMAPIAVGIANTLGVNLDPFLMAVAIGASSAFLTPIGHQSNTLVMGPGGYEFTDYWRVGLPLDILIALISIPLLLTFWPI